jgi:hypothetical protein
MNHLDSNKISIPPLPVAAISALRRGNKIEAIKILREVQNIGLAEAKDAIENYIQSQPSLKSSLRDSQAEATWYALFALLVVLGLGVAIYYGFTKQ